MLQSSGGDSRADENGAGNSPFHITGDRHRNLRTRRLKPGCRLKLWFDRLLAQRLTRTQPKRSAKALATGVSSFYPFGVSRAADKIEPIEAQE
ncbi:MAG: hypothetical protein L7W43_02245 [Rubripirellula sp.]|nr:hypothetical protein [Rubripirellula sp.]